jgi:hypothetical protein
LRCFERLEDVVVCPVAHKGRSEPSYANVCRDASDFHVVGSQQFGLFWAIKDLRPGVSVLEG